DAARREKVRDEQTRIPADVEDHVRVTPHEVDGYGIRAGRQLLAARNDVADAALERGIFRFLLRVREARAGVREKIAVAPFDWVAGEPEQILIQAEADARH